MPGHATPAERSMRSLWIAFLLSFTLCCISLVVVGVVTKEIDEILQNGIQPSSIEVIAFTVHSEEVPVTQASASAAPMVLQILRALAKELLKQAIDQPGHFLIAAVPIWLSRHLTGVPWYGWPMIPLLAYREWLQWPSNRWWDPPLDWAVLILGVIVATWALDSLRRAGETRP